MTHLALFAGIGGFNLAADWSGYKTVAWCEWDKFCQQILAYYWPEAERFSDINQSNFSNYEGKIDLLTAGFPCQPVSLAGSRKGADDDRWGWPATLRVIKQVKPRVIILENVAGLTSILESAREIVVENTQTDVLGQHYNTTTVSKAKRVLATIVEQLQAAGYETPQHEDGTPIVFNIPACAVNAPHRRSRIWIVAYAHDGSRPQHRFSTGGNVLENSTKESGNIAYSHGIGGREQFQQPSCQETRTRQELERSCREFSSFAHDSSERREKQREREEPSKSERFERLVGPSVVEHSHHQRRNEPSLQSSAIEQRLVSERFNADRSDWRNFPIEPPLCSRNDGVSVELVGITVSKHRNESLKGYGNAIVPQLAYEIMSML